jgi:hypothetical protein
VTASPLRFARLLRRRAQWAEVAQTFVPLLVVLAVIGQLADAATFTVGSQILGIRYEANGIAAGIYRRTGLDGLLLVKDAVIVLTVAVLLVLAVRLPRAFTVGAAAATAIGLLGAVTNVTTVSAVIR